MSGNPHIYPYKLEDNRVKPGKKESDRKNIKKSKKDLLAKSENIEKNQEKNRKMPKYSSKSQCFALSDQLVGGGLKEKDKQKKIEEFYLWKDKPFWSKEHLNFPRTIGKISLTEIFLILIGFALGRGEILGGILPFATAFIASTTVDWHKRKGLFAIPVILGTISLLGINSLAYIISDLLVVAVFMFYNVDEKKKWIIAPAVAFSSLVVVRVLFKVFGVMTSYDLMLIFFEGLFASGLTAIMLIGLNGLKALDIGEKLSIDELVCIFVMLLGVVGGLAQYKIYDISLAQVVSRFLIILTAYFCGAGAGAGIGALVGFVPSLSMMIAPSTIGVYAFSGLLAGAFNIFEKIGVALGFFLGHIMLSLYLVETSAIPNEMLTSLIPILAFFLIPQKYLSKGKKLFSTTVLKSEAEDRSDRILQFSAGRLRETASIFRELSLNCSQMAKKEVKDERENVETVLNHLHERLCDRCSMANLCWKIDFEQTYTNVIELFGKADENGYIMARDVPESFQRRCPHIQELVATINCLYELYCKTNYWQEQKSSSQKFLAEQLGGTADVLENLACQVRGQNREKDSYEKSILVGLNRNGLPTESVNIMSLSEKTVDIYITFTACPGENVCRELVANIVSQTLNRKLQVHEVSCGRGNYGKCSFHLLLEGARKLNIGKAQLAKSSGGICGDSDACVSIGEGKKMLLLSDGMGVGFKAAMYSSVAVNMLSRLLEVGFQKDTAIEAVNTILKMQGEESGFVTLDICMVDLYEGRAEFIKTGSSPSFIKRGDEVILVKSNSLPVGILEEVDKSITEVNVMEGDLIVLASDGLLDADSPMDIKWLTKILEQSNINEAQNLADYLLKKAVAVSGGRLKDDITVLVAKVCKNDVA